MKESMFKNNSIIRQARLGRVSVDDLALYLIRAFPTPDLCQALAEYIIDDEQVEPIPISEEQFRLHFRIIGTKMVNGEIVKENRGRAPGTKVVGGTVVKDKLLGTDKTNKQ